jgi:hypothetical protein
MTPRTRRATAFVFTCVVLTSPSTERTAGAAPDESEVDRLVKQLGSDDFNEREAATQALVRLGPPAAATLVKAAANSKDAEVRRRAAELLQFISSGGWARKYVEEMHGTFRNYDNGDTVHVDLSGTRVQDGDLGFLKKLEGLHHLDLAATRVTDAGLAQISGMRNLFFLDLSKTSITDTGLKHLRGLGTLRILNLAGTRVTERGIAELREALPNLNIHRD